MLQVAIVLDSEIFHQPSNRRISSCLKHRFGVSMIAERKQPHSMMLPPPCFCGASIRIAPEMFIRCDKLLL